MSFYQTVNSVNHVIIMYILIFFIRGKEIEVVNSFLKFS